VNQLSIGTRIQAASQVWTVVSCGNGYYGMRADGGTRVYSVRCAEAIADINAGRAVIL
jgi:hypothetical protein